MFRPEARGMDRTIRGADHAPSLALAGRAPSQRSPAGQRRVARDACGADGLRPREAGGARRHRRSCYGSRTASSTRSTCGSACCCLMPVARPRQSVRARLRPRRGRATLARGVPESARLAAVDGARVSPTSRRRSTRSTSRSTGSRRPWRAARDQGGAARPQRVPARRRPRSAADVLPCCSRSGRRCRRTSSSPALTLGVRPAKRRSFDAALSASPADAPASARGPMAASRRRPPAILAGLAALARARSEPQPGAAPGAVPRRRASSPVSIR